MSVKLASESSYNLSRQMGRTGDPLHKQFFGFLPGDSWAPNVNLYETETFYLVCVDLAGVDRSAIEVVVHEQRLKLKGKRAVPLRADMAETDSARPRKVKVHLMEIDHGNFNREVELPADVDQTEIAARFEEGLLWVELPKK